MTPKPQTMDIGEPFCSNGSTQSPKLTQALATLLLQKLAKKKKSNEARLYFGHSVDPLP